MYDTYEVQTQFVDDCWENCWSVDGEPWRFKTPAEAYWALADMFEGLAAAGMADDYDPADYRVIRVDNTAPTEEN